MRTLIASLGNTLMGDDAAGAAVLGELRRRGLDSSAALKDLHAGGAGLLLELGGVDSLILVDAMLADAPPGAVLVFQDQQLLRHAARGGGSHQPGLAETLRLAAALGLAPARVALVGVVALQFDLGAGLSPEVERAIPRAADAVERLATPSAG